MSYIRTRAGTDAVLNTKIAMPRPMKALLIAMNGQFDPYVYASRLPHELDVSAMLETLVEAGYIRALHSNTSQTVDSASPQSAPHPAHLPSPNPRSLQNAIASMTDFVMLHLPDQALEIVLALEHLNSATELEASLPGYESEIRHLGSAATHHLSQVRQLL
jgi:hypothetical protein